MKRAAAVLPLLLLALPSSAAPPATDTARRFERAAAFLETGGQTYIYLNTENVRAKINTLLDQGQILAGEQGPMIAAVRGMLFDLGLGDTGEWGMSTVPAGGLYRSRYHLGFRNDHRGVLWSIWAPTTEKTLPGLALAPAEAIVAFGLRPDVKGLADKFTAWIATTPMASEFEKGLARAAKDGVHLMDMLRASGTEWVVSFQLDALRPIPTPVGTFGEPSLVIALKGTGPEFRKNADALVAALHLPLATDPAPVPGLVRVAAGEMPPFLQPCWGESNGWFILASQPRLYADTAARIAGRGESLASTPEFKELSAGLPTEGSEFIFVSGKVRDLQMKIMQASGVEITPMLPLFEALTSNPATLSVTQVSANALLTSANTKADPIADALVVPTVGMGAALILPAVARARGAAMNARQANVARQLLMGRMMAITDSGKVPDLEALRKDYVNGLDTDAFEFTDEWYKADVTGGDVIVLREKQATNGRRAVGYADGHVETIQGE
ncbi:MAG: hypothetical protein U1F77_11065 [Kiritimatiellia bacterium]